MKLTTNFKLKKMRLSSLFCLALCILVCVQPTKSSAQASQQSFLVKGTVTDGDRVPLAGALILIPYTNTVAVTNANGEYEITVGPNDTDLSFSLTGYVSVQEKIGARREINVAMREDVNELENVVVIGYGTQKKATLTGAISSISTKELLQSPQANISNSLVGRMPGLFAVQRSGEPGKDASILRIRGIGTFVEGATQEPLIMVDGIESNNFNNIDPSEIESLTILKDASATAVYGVRGANGVILITTKRGEIGKPKISFSSNAAISDFPFLRQNMNSYEYATHYDQGLKNDRYVTGNTVLKYEGLYDKFKNHSDPIFYPDVDWYDFLLKKVTWQTKNNLNISGGTEKVKYFFSIGYFFQDGMIDTKIYDPGYDYGINYNRYNLRSNVDVNITKNLTASFNLSTQIDDLRGVNWDTGLMMEMLSSTRPMASPGIIDNKIITLNNVEGGGGSPPLAPINNGWTRNYGNNIDGAVRLNYKMDYLTKGLSLRGAVSYQNTYTDRRRFDRTGVSYEARREDEYSDILYVPSNDPQHVRTGSEVSKNRRIYIEGGIYYDRTFGDHNVTGLILYNQSKYYSPTLQDLVPNGYQGLAGRVTYRFKNRYLADINIGYNGTENFAKGRRFGFFPAYSLGWIISEESFIPMNNVMTFLKIRGTYGTVGNDVIGGARFLYRPTVYDSGKGYWFGEIGSNYQKHETLNEGKLGNPLLTWERARKWNIGFDGRFWKSKIGVTFDYWEENRDNILWNRGTVPVIVGAEFPAYNLGKMYNKGLDFEITYNDKVGSFNYFVRGIYSYAHNKIVYQDEAQWEYPYRQATGNIAGQFFGLIADGLYNTWEEVNDVNRPVYQWTNNKIQPGDIRYVDINGDGKINDDDKVPIGYSNFPEITYGVSFGGEYKGFDFSILFQGATNVSNLPSRRTMRGFYENTGAHTGLLKSWSQERYDSGQEIIYPRIAITESDHNYQTSTYWLEDASYLRLKNAEIGYTFRGRGFTNAGIESLRIYVNGNNLLTWCKLFPGQDPEYPTGEANSEPYPVMRTFNLGFNINF